MTTVTLLEAYHALVKDYLVDQEEVCYKINGLTRSRRIWFIPITLEVVRKALEIAKSHNVRSFDASLIGSAEVNKISIIISNDMHVTRLCKERRLALENPIPKEVRERMKM